jgi:hypothetical protein
MKSWVAERETSSPVGTADPNGSSRGVQSSLRDLILSMPYTQDFILGYQQASLRDFILPGLNNHTAPLG